MYLIVRKVDGHIEENNGKLWDGIKKGEYDKDFMKIKFNADDNLPLNKPLKLHLLTIIVKCIFEEDGKFYSQLYLDDCLYKLRV